MIFDKHNFNFKTAPRYITTVVTIDIVYDHDQIQKLQRKQTLGVGITYNLGYKIERDKTSVIKPFVN